MRTLPDFQHPPLVEVVLGVQFDPIGALRSPHLGLFWQRHRHLFPKVDERLPLEPAVERFGVQSLSVPRFRISKDADTNRVWFLNEDGTQLIQVQRDRFIHNWRKQDASDEYPRYETIITSFLSELTQFASFVADENLGGPIRINQCEVTYVNIIEPIEGVFETHGDVEKVVKFLALPACEYLGKPEDLTLVARHIISDANGRPIGRLYIELTPVFIGEKGSEGYKLQLTARGVPGSAAIEDAKQFMDVGHDWIVNGFTCITTSAMHERWGRLQ